MKCCICGKESIPINARQKTCRQPAPCARLNRNAVRKIHDALVNPGPMCHSVASRPASELVGLEGRIKKLQRKYADEAAILRGRSRGDAIYALSIPAAIADEILKRVALK